MLTATVIELEAGAAGTILGGSGRAVHGFWHSHWAAVAPQIADRLHQPAASRPFTVSALMGLPRPRQGITYVGRGMRAWLRVTTLDPELSTCVDDFWLPRLPPTLTLATIPWRPLNVWRTAEEHEWAARSSYHELAEPHGSGQGRWPLEFALPTSFKRGGNLHMPFPLPELLLGSWWRRWQAHAPLPLPDETRLPWAERVAVSSYRLQTVAVRYARRLTIGFVGRATLSAHNLTPADCDLVTLLARFAFFAGSGQHTTQGMGMTRLV